jgi:hypothetical protein
MAEAPQVFRSALEARYGRWRHALPCPAPAPLGRRVVAELDEFRLVADLDDRTGLFETAWHDGPSAPLDRTVLDVFCDVLEGLTPQEAAEHGAHRLLSRLSSDLVGRPVPGICLPSNADPIFARPLSMAALLYRSSGLTSGRNAFASPTSLAWSGLESSERLARIDALLQSGLEDVGFPGGIVHRVSLDEDILNRPIRVTIAFGGDTAAAAKPELTRRCERALRRALEPLLEVYVEELKDQSGIRRL